MTNELSTQQRDFLLLSIFVLAQHGYTDRASALAELLHILGDASHEVTLARAILRFCARDWEGTLVCLNELDRVAPIERFGAYTMNDLQRMRRYLKARCFYELKDYANAKDVIESYLRHGSETANAAG